MSGFDAAVDRRALRASRLEAVVLEADRARVNTDVDAPGSRMLLDATEYCVANTPLLVNRSIRGVPVPANR